MEENLNESIIPKNTGDENTVITETNNGDKDYEGTPEPEHGNDSDTKYFKTFETKEEYQDNIDRIFNSRFKDYKETKSKYENLMSNLKNYFDTDDDDAAVNMFSNHMDKQQAEKKGLSLEDYRKYSALEKKAGMYDSLVMQQQEQRARQAHIDSVRSELTKAADAIKAADSSFDLVKAYRSDSTFKKTLEETGSVPQAYTAMMNNKKKTPAFRENGSSYISTGHISATAANLSDADFEEYIKKIEGTL